MEEIRDFDAKFKNLLKETEKAMYDYIDSKIMEKSEELLDLQAVLGLNAMVRLEECYLTILRRAAEEYRKYWHFESKDKNKKTAELLHHYANFCKNAAKEGEDLYRRIENKLGTTYDPETDIRVPAQPFAFNVRIFPNPINT